jgi:hypothetical protein
MDNEGLILLARFTFQARKLIGAIDSNLIANDEIYRNSIFQQIDAQADEALLMLSMQLRDKLGTLSPLANSKEIEEKPASENKKYIFGARG